MVTGTPVAAVNFFVFSSQTVWSLLTNAVQRKSCSDAPFSGLNGESAADASAGKPPATVAAPIPAADMCKNRRRSGWLMDVLSKRGAAEKNIRPALVIPASIHSAVRK